MQQVAYNKQPAGPEGDLAEMKQSPSCGLPKHHPLKLVKFKRYRPDGNVLCAMSEPGLRVTVACQREGTTALPRAWDHCGAVLSMRVIGGGSQWWVVGGGMALR